MRMPRHSTIVAYLALFIALGGTATATGVIKLRPNSVGSREIRNGSITRADLSPLIRPTAATFRAAVTDIVTDPATGIHISVTGEKGDSGAPGAQGPTGASGPATVSTRDALSPTIDPGQTGGIAAHCLPGEKVVGGGARFEGGSGAVIPKFSEPETDGWSAAYTNVSQTANDSGVVHVFALCAA